MSRFKTLRAHLSHSLLRNGILLRLGVTSEFFIADEGTREEVLTAALCGIDQVTDNHRRAVIVWSDGAEDRAGVRASMAELLREARCFRTRRPSALFPNDQEIASWLDAMEDFLNGLERTSKLDRQTRQESARAFARAAISLFDLLRDLDVESDASWKYFERTRRRN